ncbi:MAG: flagellar basal body P-ring protein FlgI [Planctomycetota bacterium]
MHGTLRGHPLLFGLITLLCAASFAPAQIVRQMATIEGQGASRLQGLGLVMGLPGTGDSGKDLYVARPLAEVLRNYGLPIAAFEELRSTRSVALVLVSCEIPSFGARQGDRFDVTVTSVGSAASLAGGMLALAPLTGPFPGSDAFAMSSGDLVIHDEAVPTKAVVRGGAQMIQDVRMPTLGAQFNLLLDPSYASWSASTQVAAAINDHYFNSPEALGPPVAEAEDERTVRITVPLAERRAPAAFIADVLGAPVNPALLRRPPKIVVNSNTGAIVVTGDVRIGAVAITHRDLRITTTTPQVQPTPENPLVETDSWAGVGTDLRDGDRARLEDLLEALRQLDVPVEDQIQILFMLQKSGQLQARIEVD